MNCTHVRYVVKHAKDNTVAVVEADVCVEVAKTMYGFATTLGTALTNWYHTTEDGKMAWQETTQKFNVSNLAALYRLQRTTELKLTVDTVLAKYGIHCLSIHVYKSIDDSDNLTWAYEDILYDKEFAEVLRAEAEEPCNSNTLEGMKCPQCGSLGPYEISANTLFTIADEGIASYDCDGTTWERDAFCRCALCKHEATVGDFTVFLEGDVTIKFVSRAGEKTIELGLNHGDKECAFVVGQRYEVNIVATTCVGAEPGDCDITFYDGDVAYFVNRDLFKIVKTTDPNDDTTPLPRKHIGVCCQCHHVVTGPSKYSPQGVELVGCSISNDPQGGHNCPLP